MAHIQKQCSCCVLQSLPFPLVPPELTRRYDHKQWRGRTIDGLMYIARSMRAAQERGHRPIQTRLTRKSQKETEVPGEEFKKTCGPVLHLSTLRQEVQVHHHLPSCISGSAQSRKTILRILGHGLDVCANALKFVVF